MSLRQLINLITISGIFKKDDDLDILPPPPPFPEIEEEEEKVKDVERIREEREKQNQKELELERKKEEQKKRQEERERKEAELRERREREIEKRRKEKLRQEKKKARGKKVFDFFHGLGLIKTEKEKIEIGKQKLEYKRHKELSKKKAWQERVTREKEKQKEKELEIKRRREEEIKKQEEIERQQREVKKREQKELELKKKGKLELEKEIPKKKPFSGILSRKGVDLELERELKEIEEIAPKPVKKIKETKLEIPEFEKIEKPMDMEKAEDEIQKAIQGMKMKKRPSIISGLFKKKEKVEKKIETPEVMPRTYDKIDYVELIEEKIHKARLFLMDFRFDEAKEVYIEIMRMYTELEPKKKVKVYQDIRELYYERKSAEKFAK